MKGKMSIPGIIGSVVVLGGALLYTQFKSDNYELPQEWKAASGQTVEYYYIRRLPDRQGGYRNVDCYVVKAFQNEAGARVEPGCIQKYKMEAICAVANCRETQR